jgi:hypothetical protein
MAATLVPAGNARAQVLVVVVSDSATKSTLSDAMVSLIDSSADLLHFRRTDLNGRAALNISSGAGLYAVRVERRGYQGLISNWIPVANTDTLEVTIRLRRLTELPEVVVAAQRDSITPLLPPGINPKAISGKVLVPADIARHTMGARDYVDVIESLGVAGLTTRIIRATRFTPEHRCLASVRGGGCAMVLVNNMRATPEQAINLATPENLDFAVWLRAVDAGVLYGTDSADGVVLLFTKDYRAARTARPPEGRS